MDYERELAYAIMDLDPLKDPNNDHRQHIGFFPYMFEISSDIHLFKKLHLQLTDKAEVGCRLLVIFGGNGSLVRYTKYAAQNLLVVWFCGSLVLNSSLGICSQLQLCPSTTVLPNLYYFFMKKRKTAMKKLLEEDMRFEDQELRKIGKAYQLMQP